MAINLEDEQIIDQGEIFEFSRQRNSQLLAIEIPFTKQRLLIVLTSGLETIHLTPYHIISSSYMADHTTDFIPDRYIERTSQLAPFKLIYRNGKTIKKIPAAFRLKSIGNNPQREETLLQPTQHRILAFRSSICPLIDPKSS